MHQPVSDLQQMLAGMEPVWNAGIYAYTAVPHGADLSLLTPITTVHEAEGLTLILPEQQALEQGLPILMRCAWITLNVHSDLNACGLTAAFATALAAEAISCNVVAGAYHDHLFVPLERAGDALLALQRLQGASVGLV